MEEKDIAFEMSGLFYFAISISKYSLEEQYAIFGMIPMTEGILKKCMATGNSICDFENMAYLKRKYPQFLNE